MGTHNAFLKTPTTEAYSAKRAPPIKSATPNPREHLATTNEPNPPADENHQFPIPCRRRTRPKPGQSQPARIGSTPLLQHPGLLLVESADMGTRLYCAGS